jgi:hypothetical protein
MWQSSRICRAFGTRRIKARAQQSGRVQEQSPAEVRMRQGLVIQALRLSSCVCEAVGAGAAFL